MLSGKLRAEITEHLPQGRFAIGFSGGGDSTALVHLCRDISPRPLVLIVDHALRPGSDLEAQTAKLFAEDLGLETQILVWENGGVSSGIQEKARLGRYALMGQACRDHGIHHLLTAHTSNDQAETLLMRYEKKTRWRGAAGMAKSAYAPIWPELATINLHRPLLGFSRQVLREYNNKHDLNWIDDPSNEDRKFERIRARDYLRARPAKAKFLNRTAKDLRLGIQFEKQYLTRTLNFTVDDYGLIYTPRKIPDQFLNCCISAAGGTGQNISRSRLRSFNVLIGSDQFSSATILGSLCVTNSDQLIFGTEPSSFKGRSDSNPIRPVTLSRGQSMIWNGRFFVKAKEDIQILPAKTSSGEYQINGLKESLKDVPGPFRGSVPIFTKPDGKLLGYSEVKLGELTSICLVAERLQHLLGLNDNKKQFHDA